MSILFDLNMILIFISSHFNFIYELIIFFFHNIKWVSKIIEVFNFRKYIKNDGIDCWNTEIIFIIN